MLITFNNNPRLTPPKIQVDALQRSRYTPITPGEKA